MVVEIEERVSARAAQRPSDSRAITHALRTTAAIVLAAKRNAVKAESNGGKGRGKKKPGLSACFRRRPSWS